jgi:hypothetical protein
MQALVTRLLSDAAAPSPAVPTPRRRGRPPRGAAAAEGQTWAEAMLRENNRRLRVRYERLTAVLDAVRIPYLKHL